MEARRKRMVELIRQEGEVSIARLKECFSDVSEMTLRRDLEFLDRNKQIVRVYGGAKSIGAVVGLSEEVYAKRSRDNVEEKNLIAKKALRLLQPNMSVFVDSGSTTTALTHIMPDKEFLIYTSGITCAVELARLSKSTVYLLGGELSRNSLSTQGSQPAREIECVNFDIAFLGVTGFTLEKGFTTGLSDDCRLKRTVIDRTREIVVLMDSSKIGKVLPYTFAQLDQIDTVVVDEKIDPDIVQRLEDAEVRVI
ncbi:MAG: DeoR/GlpR transcriptional regulator [Firmicutes bacterium]|jgi:DeoR family transcriptional regulator of aga operon|nr:DeoR/GlpR transcriptional regulator [Bacillota bacterium]